MNDTARNDVIQAQELGGKHRFWLLINLLWWGILLNLSTIHHDHPIRNSKCFLLIVRHINGGQPYPLDNITQF